ncbi:MAG: nitrite reductase small subunit NirD [Pseudomonadota bacterium]
MSEHSVQWYELGPVSTIPLRGSRRVVINDQTIGLFRTATDSVHAIEDQCPHKRGPLSEGIVHDNCVTCPLHNWVISLETGEAQGADSGSVTVFPVTIDNGNVRIAVTSHAPAEIANATD